VVKLILEKVVAIREQQTKRITQQLIKQLEQPNKFKNMKKFEGNLRSQKLRPIAINTRLDYAIEGVDGPEHVTKGKATFKQALE
jgi:hypothetical protein